MTIMGMDMKQGSIRRGRRAASLLAVLGAASALAAGCGGGSEHKAGPAGNGPVPPTIGANGTPVSDSGAQGEVASAAPAGTTTAPDTAQRAERKSVAAKKAHGFAPRRNVAKVVVPKADVRRTTSRPVRPVGHPDNQAATNESKHKKKSSGQIAAAAKAAAASASNSPCRLVTRGEASAILGRTVTQTLAPQGPTCIFATGRQAQGAVTLSVQQVPFATILKSARVVAHQRVGDHTIYCLQVGARATYVPLSAARVLYITGACATGTRFARKALSRV